MGRVNIAMRGNDSAVGWVIAHMKALPNVEAVAGGSGNITFLDLDIDESAPPFETKRPRRTRGDTEKFREKVRQMLDAGDKTQVEIAKELGCSRAYVSRIATYDYW